MPLVARRLRWVYITDTVSLVCKMGTQTVGLVAALDRT